MSSQDQTVFVDVPTELGPYRLTRILGRGGMGEVWQAFDTNLERDVAVKLMRRELLANEEAVRRFGREARAVARLNHSNIVQVYAFGDQKGVLYFVMEMVEGETVSDVIKRRGCLSLEESVLIMLQAVEGLSYASVRGIVHRDIKPSNLMLTPDNRVKIADFGLAKMMEQDSQVTAAGSTMGSPNYMSPEQARGEEADHRSDIYSLGITFYQMLTGQLPFTAQTPLSVLLMQIQNPLPEPQFLRDIADGRALQIIKRMAEKSAGDRYQTYAELAADIAQLCPGAHVGHSAYARTMSMPASAGPAAPGGGAGASAAPAGTLTGGPTLAGGASISEADLSPSPPSFVGAAGGAPAIPPPVEMPGEPVLAGSPAGVVADDTGRTKTLAASPEALRSLPDAVQGSSGSGAKSRWLIPAAAAAGLLVLAGAAILLRQQGSGSDARGGRSTVASAGDAGGSPAVSLAAAGAGESPSSSGSAASVAPSPTASGAGASVQPSPAHAQASPAPSAAPVAAGSSPAPAPPTTVVYYPVAVPAGYGTAPSPAPAPGQRVYASAQPPLIPSPSAGPPATPAPTLTPVGVRADFVELAPERSPNDQIQIYDAQGGAAFTLPARTRANLLQASSVANRSMYLIAFQNQQGYVPIEQAKPIYTREGEQPPGSGAAGAAARLPRQVVVGKTGSSAKIDVYEDERLIRLADSVPAGTRLDVLDETRTTWKIRLPGTGAEAHVPKRLATPQP